MLGQALISAYDPYAQSKDDPDLCPNTQGGTNANILLCSFIGAAVLLQFFIKEDLRRQRAEKNEDQQTEEPENAAELWKIIFPLWNIF